MAKRINSACISLQYKCEITILHESLFDIIFIIMIISTEHHLVYYFFYSNIFFALKHSENQRGKVGGIRAVKATIILLSQKTFSAAGAMHNRLPVKSRRISRELFRYPTWLLTERKSPRLFLLGFGRNFDSHCAKHTTTDIVSCNMHESRPGQ